MKTTSIASRWVPMMTQSIPTVPSTVLRNALFLAVRKESHELKCGKGRVLEMTKDSENGVNVLYKVGRRKIAECLVLV